MNISSAMLWMSNRKFTDDGIAVTYANEAGTTTGSVTAVQGKTAWESDGSDGGPIIKQDTPDWFIKVAAITALLSREPKAGDKITYDGRVFQIMNPSGGGAPWEWANWPHRSVYRIHSKQIGDV